MICPVSTRVLPGSVPSKCVCLTVGEKELIPPKLPNMLKGGGFRGKATSKQHLNSVLLETGSPALDFSLSQDKKKKKKKFVLRGAS